MTGQLEEIKYINNLSGVSKQEEEDVINMDELKKLNESFNYETPVLVEETLDDFDTSYEALRIGLEKEIKNFVVNILENNVEMFLWTFENPTTETFKDVWTHLVVKFTTSDERVRDQFLNRVRILFRNIFLEKYEVSSEENALELADAYFTVFKVAISQRLNDMKPTEGQSAPLAQDATTDDIVYR